MADYEDFKRGKILPGSDETLDSLSEEELATIGQQLFSMLIDTSGNQTSPPPQAPEAQRVLNTIDRGMERIDRIPPRLPAPRKQNNFQGLQNNTQQLPKPNMGQNKIPRGAGQRVKQLLMNRGKVSPMGGNQMQQRPQLYNNLGNQNMQQRPFMSFDPNFMMR